MQEQLEDNILFYRSLYVTWLNNLEETLGHENIINQEKGIPHWRYIRNALYVMGVTARLSPEELFAQLNIRETDLVNITYEGLLRMDRSIAAAQSRFVHDYSSTERELDNNLEAYDLTFLERLNSLDIQQSVIDLLESQQLRTKFPIRLSLAVLGVNTSDDQSLREHLASEEAYLGLLYDFYHRFIALYCTNESTGVASIWKMALLERIQRFGIDHTMLPYEVYEIIGIAGRIEEVMAQMQFEQMQTINCILDNYNALDTALFHPQEAKVPAKVIQAIRLRAQKSNLSIYQILINLDITEANIDEIDSLQDFALQVYASQLRRLEDSITQDEGQDYTNYSSLILRVATRVSKYCVSQGIWPDQIENHWEEILEQLNISSMIEAGLLQILESGSQRSLINALQNIIKRIIKIAFISSETSP